MQHHDQLLSDKRFMLVSDINYLDSDVHNATISNTKM